MTGNDQSGHAFPCDATTNLYSRGMTLRDYFAAKTLSGLLADPNGPPIDNNQQAYEYAKHCYRIADAMLQVRSA